MGSGDLPHAASYPEGSDFQQALSPLPFPRSPPLPTRVQPPQPPAPWHRTGRREPTWAADLPPETTVAHKKPAALRAASSTPAGFFSLCEKNSSVTQLCSVQRSAEALGGEKRMPLKAKQRRERQGWASLLPPRVWPAPLRGSQPPGACIASRASGANSAARSVVRWGQPVLPLFDF